MITVIPFCQNMAVTVSEPCDVIRVGSDHIVFKSQGSGMMKVQYRYHPRISLFVVVVDSG